MTAWQDKLGANLIMTVLRLMALIPLPVSRWLGKMIGMINYRFNTRAMKVSRANIEVCLPELTAEEQDSLVRQSLIETGRTMIETPAAWLASADRLSRWIKHVENEDVLDNAIAKGRGVIVLLPHLGSWELFNVWYARRGSLTALYSPPRQRYLVEVMRDIRHGFGNDLVPTNVKGIATLYRRLDEGKVITVLPDQVPASGVYAPFFDIDCLTDRLVPRLLQKTDASVVCVYVRRRADGDGFDVVFREADRDIYSQDIAVSAAALNASIEACVRDVPAQYQWEYKRFRERPAGERKLYRFNGPAAYH